MVDKAAAAAAKAKGNACLQSGDFQGAVDAYTEAIGHDPNDKVFYSNRSAAFASMKNFEKALEDGKKSVELDPSFAKGYGRVGAALHGMGKYEEAVQIYNKGLEVDPNSAQLKQALRAIPIAGGGPPEPEPEVSLGPEPEPEVSVEALKAKREEFKRRIDELESTMPAVQTLVGGAVGMGGGVGVAAITAGRLATFALGATTPLGLAAGLLGGLVVGASLFRPAACTASDDTHLLLENDTLTTTFGQFSQDVVQRLQREISQSELQDAKDKCYEDNEASHQQWVVLSRLLKELDGVLSIPEKYVYAEKQLVLGKAGDAALGITELLGVSDSEEGTYLQQHEVAIEREIHLNGDAQDKENLHCILTGTKKLGWGAACTIDSLLAHDSARTAKLGRHHIIALRFYTTSSFRSINDPLRADPPQRPHPFAATVYFITQGIKKLRAVGPNAELVLWRGMKDCGIKSQFLLEGGTDYACVSTTDNKDVAVEQFAKSSLPLVFRVVAKNNMARGADISFLSAYPQEREFLYPPLTYLQCVKIEHEPLGGMQMLVATVEPHIG